MPEHNQSAAVAAPSGPDEVLPEGIDPEHIIHPKDFPYEHEDGYVCLTEGGNVFFFALPDCTGGDDHRALVMSRDDALELAHALIQAAKSSHLRPQTKTPEEEATPPDRKPQVGDRVLFHLADDFHGEPILRPAVIVRTWPEVTSYVDGVNIQVLLDGGNDIGLRCPAGPGETSMRDVVTEDEARRGSAWRTSVQRGEGVATWRWPA